MPQGFSSTECVVGNRPTTLAAFDVAFDAGFARILQVDRVTNCTELAYTLWYAPPLDGEQLIYDSASGALVGAKRISDSPNYLGGCFASTHTAGRALSTCSSTSTCILSGANAGTRCDGGTGP